MSEFEPSEIGTTGQPFRVFNSSVPEDVASWPPEFSDNGVPIIIPQAQNLVVEYIDYFPSSENLGIEIKQRSLAYTKGNIKMSIIFIWEVTNTSGELIEDAYFGCFIDSDIGNYTDDRTSFVNDMAIAWDSDFSEVGYFSKKNENGPAILGFDFLETPSSEVNFSGWTSGTGLGDPVNEIERYEYLSGVESYENNIAGDSRMLLSTGPFNIQNDQSVVVAAAFLFANAPRGTTSLTTDPEDPYRPDPEDPTLAKLLKIQNDIQIFYDQNLRGTVLPKRGDDLEITGEETVPKVFALHQNHPNPFNPTTAINYSIPEDGYVTLSVYDVLGNEVAILVDEQKQSGRYEVNFDASALPSGIYFYRLQTGNFTQTKKMILLK